MSFAISSCLPCLAQGALTLLSEFAEPTPAPGGYFGTGIAVSSGTMAIGSLGYQPGPTYFGAVHVYTGYGAQWAYAAELRDPTPFPSSHFGRELALQGDELFVGAMQDLHSTLGIQSGSVNIFRCSGATWSHVQLLEQPTPFDFGGYGAHIAAVGNTLFVSGHGGTVGPDSGLIFEYERQGASWVAKSQIPVPNGGTPWGLAYNLAFDGVRLVVGAQSSYNGALSSAGSLRVYRRSGSGWALEQTLVASDPTANAFLGSSLAVRGDRIVAGAVQWPGNFRGKVYVFERFGSTWQESQGLIASDGGLGQRFGRSITLADDHIFVGAETAPWMAAPGSGALYVFQHNGSQWAETQKLGPPTTGTAFGWRQARWLDNLFITAVGGAPNGVPNAGRVYAYDMNGAPPVEIYCASAKTTNGCSPRIRATGLASASANSGFVLRAIDVEGARQGMLFYGVSGREFLPWSSSGNASSLCVRRPTQRMTLHGSGGTLGSCTGVLQDDWNAFRAAHPAGVGQPFSAGAVVNVQAWFRDPSPLSTIALSDALEFLVLP